MIRRTARALGALLIASAGVAAPAARIGGQDPDWTAPPAAAAKSNPLAGRRETAAGGAKLFQIRCASCHGADGRGTSKGPDLRDTAVQAQTDGALFWKLTTGNTRAGMPTFSFLREPQRWQLVLYLRNRGD